MNQIIGADTGCVTEQNRSYKLAEMVREKEGWPVTYKAGELTDEKNVILAMAPEYTLARHVRLPPVVEKRVYDIIGYEADQQISFDMDEVLWSYQVSALTGSCPNYEATISAVKRDLVTAHTDSLRSPKCTTTVDALNRVVEFPQMDETDMILYFEKEKGTLMAIRKANRSTWSRYIPVGDESFDKTDHDSESIVADLTIELQRSLGFAESTYLNAPISSVWIIGEGTRLGSLDQLCGLISEKLNLQCSTEYPKNQNIRNLDIQPGYEVALGAALHALDPNAPYLSKSGRHKHFQVSNPLGDVKRAIQAPFRRLGRFFLHLGGE